MTMQQASAYIQDQIGTLYDQREAYQIAMMLLEKITHWDKVQQKIYSSAELTEEQWTTLKEKVSQLLQSRPIQYILEEAWFGRYPFYVNENVLIPRPETEELVEWIYHENKNLPNVSILDIGTGSGCIAISLKKYLPNADVQALDNSEDALNVARKNAKNLDADIQFMHIDILKNGNAILPDSLHIIVSNPPYITDQEKMEMNTNVLDFEPHNALFVPDHDPLLFYRKIAELGLDTLKENGFLYFEINENFGKELVNLLSELGYKNVELRKDLQGKDRMVKVTKIILVN